MFCLDLIWWYTLFFHLWFFSLLAIALFPFIYIYFFLSEFSAAYMYFYLSTALVASVVLQTLLTHFDFFESIRLSVCFLAIKKLLRLLISTWDTLHLFFSMLALLCSSNDTLGSDEIIILCLFLLIFKLTSSNVCYRLSSLFGGVIPTSSVSDLNKEVRKYDHISE